jgi:acetyl esterase/lipase
MTPMKDLPPYLQPFVLNVEGVADRRVDRVGELDFYRPVSTARTGAILFVHGGPGPAHLEVRPRDWPVYQGYATAAAQRGLVGALVDHSLIHGLDRLSAAADDVEAAIGVLRADPQVDPNRIALWFFSGSGLLAGEWLDSRPDWLRCLALTYPLLATPPGVDELVSAAEVIGKHKDLPVLLTRVGREREELAGPVAEFVSAGGTALDIIDVPKGQHGFDMLDHTDESRAAVTKALDWAIAHLGEDPAGQLPIPTPTASTPAPRAAERPKSPAAGEKSAVAVAEKPTAVAEKLTAVVETPAAAVEKPAVVAPVLPAETPASRVVGREHSAYEAHDLEAFLAMYSPTAQFQTAEGKVLRGRRSLREYYQPRFEAGQCKSELVHRMTQGEWVVDQSISHGDGGPTPAIAFYRVQEGLITEVRILA